MEMCLKSSPLATRAFHVTKTKPQVSRRTFILYLLIGPWATIILDVQPFERELSWQKYIDYYMINKMSTSRTALTHLEPTV